MPYYVDPKPYNVTEAVPTLCSDRQCRTHPQHGQDSRVPVEVQCYEGDWPGREVCRVARHCTYCERCADVPREQLVLTATPAPKRRQKQQAFSL